MKYSQYDIIASQYDNLFTDEISLKENNEIGGMLSQMSGNVLDIGCGTGLLLEIKDIEPHSYVGIDPSIKMLRIFKIKYPKYKSRLICASFDDLIIDSNDFNYVIALFGAASYLSTKTIKRLVGCRSKMFLMFYKKNYFPLTYEKCGVEFKHTHFSEKKLKDWFGGDNVFSYHNYMIVKKGW